MIRNGETALPFLLRFGEKLESQASVQIRHDPARQINQVEIDGTWIDAVDAKDILLEAGTKVTDVKQETTDDS